MMPRVIGDVVILDVIDDTPHSVIYENKAMPPVPTPTSNPSLPTRPLSGYTPPKINGLGLAGFIVSLVGMVVCFGVPCPVGAILSLFAIFCAPRGFAIAGLVLGVLGSALWTLLLLMAFGAIGPGVFNGWQLGSMMPQEIEYAKWDIDDAFNMNFALPDDAAGQLIVASYADDWGSPLVYHRVDDYNYEIVSAGPDQLMGTQDDITVHAMAGATSTTGMGTADAWPDGTGGFAAAHAMVHEIYGGDYNSPASTEVDPILQYTCMDQWGRPIVYRAASGDHYRLTSAGADGQWGTADDVEQTYSLGQTGPLQPPANP